MQDENRVQVELAHAKAVVAALVDAAADLTALLAPGGRYHAAFDSFMIGVSPDYVIRVREDILAEEDGPVLLHGLQGLHDKQLVLPSPQANWPDPEALGWRYGRFLKAA